MPQHPLLQTKLYIPPIRPEWVSRPRLIERLNAGLNQEQGFGRRLTLLSAPAGFGKTTLVSAWVQAMGRAVPPIAVAWLSLDGGEDDPVRFLTYLVAALQTLAPSPSGASEMEDGTPQQSSAGNLGQGLLAALQSPQPPPVEVLLGSLINEVAALPGRLVLVLDDYHLIDSQAIHDALSFLLENLPPQMHLVMATREDPAISLARLRARGQLTELRGSDLRFSTSEAAEYLNQAMGLGLSPGDIAVLETRTEGWIAGLQLAAISMQGREDNASLVRSFSGSHRFVADFMIEEVLQQQPEGVQTFLLQTAILDRLTGSLCDAVRFGEAEPPSSSDGTAVRFGGAEPPSSSGGDAVRFGGAEPPSSSDGTAVRLGSAEPPSSSDGTAVRFGSAEAPSSSNGTAGSGQSILEMLDQANLFIVPLDNERRWYRYHHLFADLLRRRLHQTQPEHLSILHRRASDWYEQNGIVDEAIDHALAGADFERAAYLIEVHFGSHYEAGDEATLQRWLAGLPEELVFSRAHLCTLYAWNLFTSGQFDAAEQSLRTAEMLLDPDPDQEPIVSPERYQLSSTDRLKLAGRVAAIRSFLASLGGDVAGSIESARQALEVLPEEELEWRSGALLALGDGYANQGQMAAARQAQSDALVLGKASGDSYYFTIVSLAFAEILRQQGELQQVIDICERQFKTAAKSGTSETVVAGWLSGVWGEVLAEIDDLDRAMERAKRGVELAARGWDVMYLSMSNLCLVRVLFSSGDLTGAEDVIQAMENSARERDMPQGPMLQLSAWLGRIWLAQGKLELASQWARERGLDPHAEPDYLHETEYVVLARILIAQGRWDEAARLLQRLLEAAQAGGRVSRVIELLTLQALAAQSRGDSAQSISNLEQALALAEPGGFVRIFVDEGPPVARLLQQAVSCGIAPDYARRLLAAFSPPGPAQTGPATTGPKTRMPQAALAEPLSERELEVLQNIAEGFTNREIAGRLYISIHTVKAHARNIYGKLGVNNRTLAIARARELGLL